tara:strand:- start:10045 stop:10584 length:540 start_codon:yes stop_codon:yes gene_type:complete
MVVSYDADIERGPPPSKMEKVITVLSKVFKIKRYIILFFVAWVAFAFTCAHRDEITEFIPDPPATTRLPGRSAFRSDRGAKDQKLSDLGDSACANIGGDVNVRGTVMFDPVITKQQGKVSRVKETREDGTVTTTERYKCIMVKWSDKGFTEYHKQLCDNDAYCVQHLTDVIQTLARTEL